MLQRSSEPVPRDQLWHYAPPAVALAVANYVGNEGNDIAAGVILVAAVVYIFKVLKVKLPRF
nr:XrtV sorting system accessory protein [Novosphingobium piscinae]